MTGDFGFMRNTQTGKSNDNCDYIVLEKHRFQNGFRPHENEKRAFNNFKFLRLKPSVFEKLRFRDGFVKTFSNPLM